MAITQWDPFPDLTSLRNQVATLLPGPFFAPGRRESFMPAIDVYDEEGAVVLKAELAGVKPQDITIELDDDVLTIKGERKQEEQLDNERYHRLERSYGSFERRIAVPRGVKADDIKATCEDGVLTVRVPRTEAKKPERVAITTPKAEKVKVS